MTSFRPANPPPYSQGLRKPSDGLPVESRWSFSKEITLAAPCALAVSRVIKREGCREKTSMECLTGAEQLVPFTDLVRLLKTKRNSRACKEISGTPRPPALHKLQKVRMGQVGSRVANELVKAVILIPEKLEVDRHGVFLVSLSRKVHQ